VHEQPLEEEIEMLEKICEPHASSNVLLVGTGWDVPADKMVKVEERELYSKRTLGGVILYA
jgi:hypothetical protein